MEYDNTRYLLAQAMGNLRNAKCESAKGNLRNHVRKMRAKNG